MKQEPLQASELIAETVAVAWRSRRLPLWWLLKVAGSALVIVTALFVPLAAITGALVPSRVSDLGDLSARLSRGAVAWGKIAHGGLTLGIGGTLATAASLLLVWGALFDAGFYTRLSAEIKGESTKGWFAESLRRLPRMLRYTLARWTLLGGSALFALVATGVPLWLGVQQWLDTGRVSMTVGGLFALGAAASAMLRSLVSLGSMLALGPLVFDDASVRSAFGQAWQTLVNDPGRAWRISGAAGVCGIPIAAVLMLTLMPALVLDSSNASALLALKLMASTLFYVALPLGVGLWVLIHRGVFLMEHRRRSDPVEVVMEMIPLPGIPFAMPGVPGIEVVRSPIPSSSPHCYRISSVFDEERQDDAASD